MKVALVQRGAPLEIVTNTHSKRKTETMILFDANTRFYGADASSLLARKPLQTPMLMNIMLGRDDEHPCVKVSQLCAWYMVLYILYTQLQMNLWLMLLLTCNSLHVNH
jgi:molecular chaperone DnaK (HSP70)